MSGFLTPRNAAIAGSVGAAIFLFPRTRKAINPIGEESSNVFETPGVKNVGKRYAAQGGTETHMPGVATPRGSSEKQVPNKTELGGPVSGKFRDRIADQKEEMTEIGKSFRKAQIGSGMMAASALPLCIPPREITLTSAPVSKEKGK